MSVFMLTLTLYKTKESRMLKTTEQSSPYMTHVLPLQDSTQTNQRFFPRSQDQGDSFWWHR